MFPWSTLVRIICTVLCNILLLRHMNHNLTFLNTPVSPPRGVLSKAIRVSHFFHSIPQLALSVLLAAIHALPVLACHSHLSPSYVKLNTLFVRAYVKAAVLDISYYKCGSWDIGYQGSLPTAWTLLVISGFPSQLRRYESNIQQQLHSVFFLLISLNSIQKCFNYSASTILVMYVFNTHLDMGFWGILCVINTLISEEAELLTHF